MNFIKKFLLSIYATLLVGSTIVGGPGLLGETLTVRLDPASAGEFTQAIFNEIGQGGNSVGEFADNGLRSIAEAINERSPELWKAVGKNNTEGLATVLGQNGQQATTLLGERSVELVDIFRRSSDLVSKNVLKNALRVAVPLAAVGITYVVAQYVAYKYINRYLFEPKLIAKQQSKSLLGQSFSYVKALCGAGQKPPLSKIMVIDKSLEEQLNLLIAMTKNVKANGGTFDNAILHGLPGTGKTLFAEYLAESCGMAYALIPAANVSQFLAKGQAVEELNNLFTWAARQRGGTLLFFDEAETFLGKRESLPLDAQNALNAFLAKTGTPSNKIMIICATNRPETLDSAILSRFGVTIDFPLPNQHGRYSQLKMHRDAVFGVQQGARVTYDCLKSEAYLGELAQKLEGCSGRSIQKFMNRVRQQALAENVLTLSPSFVNRVLGYVLASKKLEDTVAGVVQPK